MLRRLFREESGQDTFEYMLIIGGVTVAVCAAIAFASGSIFSSVRSGICTAIATLPSFSSVSC